VQEVVNVVKNSGGVIVGVGLLVDRSGGKAEFGVPKEDVQALLHLTVPTYKPEECPMCKQEIPMTERGSHHIKYILGDVCMDLYLRFFHFLMPGLSVL